MLYAFVYTCHVQTLSWDFNEYKGIRISPIIEPPLAIACYQMAKDPMLLLPPLVARARLEGTDAGVAVTQVRFGRHCLLESAVVVGHKQQTVFFTYVIYYYHIILTNAPSNRLWGQAGVLRREVQVFILVRSLYKQLYLLYVSPEGLSAPKLGTMPTL